jgi:hypothetical protein
MKKSINEILLGYSKKKTHAEAGFKRYANEENE